MQPVLWQLTELFLASRCALCGAADQPESIRGSAFCESCRVQLAPDPVNRCQKCAAEIGPYARSDQGCVHCRRRRLRFDTVVCLGMYSGALRRALLAAKWSFSAVRIRSLGTLLAGARIAQLRETPIDRVIPIPQHWRQRLVRNFNPATVIAEELARQLRTVCDVHSLRRTSRTRPQKRVSVTQRLRNQAGALAVTHSASVEGQRILIVDDVLTTGATCSEAAKVLKAAGARSCTVAVLARVLDHSG